MNESRAFMNKEILRYASKLADSMGISDRNDLIGVFAVKIREVIIDYKIGHIFEEVSLEKSMKHLKPFKLFENLDDSTLVTIEVFLEKIRIPEPLRPAIISWWIENRSEINLHVFPFNTPHPISGVFLGENVIVINESSQMPPHVKLFLALHESRHCDQHRDGVFMIGYYDTVVNGERDAFLQSYRHFERDANDFAIQSMRACGFGREMDFEEVRLRGNERAGEMVYKMMSEDIRRLNPIDFFDLLKKQIGV